MKIFLVFYLIFKKLKSLDHDSFCNNKKKCLNVESFLKHDIYYDISGLDLFSELKV
jgi:hypothetical protein